MARYLKSEKESPIRGSGQTQKALTVTGGEGAGSDSMKGGQSAADCASFQGLDKPVAWVSKHWNP